MMARSQNGSAESSPRTGALPPYAIVSPVKDEAVHLSITIAALEAQTHPPRRWIIVDDGSTDGTREIAQAAAARLPWIEVIDSGADGVRARGGRIVRAFTRGLEEVEPGVEFVVKLDGDLFLPAHYFAWVAATFARSPRAGVVGGVVLVPHDELGWEPDRVGRHTVHGAIKAYRCRCLAEIGGLRTSMGWDGIDEYGARARGWLVHVLPELTVLHYKRRGSKQQWWRARWEEGVGNAFMGYRPAFLGVRAAYRALAERPRLLSGIVLAAGYAWARLRRHPQIDDAAAVDELRREQGERLRGLFKGRTPTAAPIPDGGPAFWPEVAPLTSAFTPQATPGSRRHSSVDH
jgi:GT2 family glycosyltransferase